MSNKPYAVLWSRHVETQGTGEDEREVWYAVKFGDTESLVRCKGLDHCSAIVDALNSVDSPEATK